MYRKIFVLTLLTILLFGCAPAVTPQAAPTIRVHATASSPDRSVDRNCCNNICRYHIDR